MAVTLVGVFFLTRGTPSSPETVTSGEAQLIRDYSQQTATESARVTLVEFGDFQCPACAGAFPTIERIKSDYAGSLNFVYRNFPLPQHKFAKKAALAAESAGIQGKYWEMYTLLFSNQPDWSTGVSVDEKFKGYAAQIGLDVDKFTTDMSATELNDRITNDIRDGNLLGVDATPTFFLNGKMYNSSLGYDSLKAAIDQVLAQ